MYARIPVPWGDEPKTQIVDGMQYGGFDSNKPVIRKKRFEDLFPVSLDVLLLVKNPPIPVHLKKLILSDEEMPIRLDWAVARGVVKAVAPKRARSQVTSRRASQAWPDRSSS